MPESQFRTAQNESLSALVDDEASELELRRLLNESESNPELKQSWHCYQLIGAAIREDLPAVEYRDLSASISAAIAEEPAPSGVGGASDKAPRASLWSSLGRVAVAASVAGAVVFGVQDYQSQLVPDNAEVAVSEVVAEPLTLSSPSGLPIGYGAPAVMARTVSAAGYTPPVPERQVSFVPRQGEPTKHNAELQAYFNHLMLEHAEHAALNASRGMMPFARVAELDTRDRFEVEASSAVTD